ncbi:MAG: MFS transporter [Myxococcales bacterium]|nr:MFS transporter [Myxococcales bacterium]
MIAVFRQKRVVLLFALGFSSGLPYLLTGATLGAWMASAEVDLGTIGLFSLVTLPYSLKVLWAPLVDRYRLPWLGRRRGWLLATQGALLCALAGLAAPDPRAAPLAIAACALVVALFSATQDIVADAYQTDVLREGERAAGSAVYVFGYRAAMLIAGALTLVLSEYLPWRTIYLLMASLMAIGVVATLAAPEPAAASDSATDSAAPRSLQEAVVAPLADYFRRPGALRILLFLTLYRVGDLVAATMVTPFLLDLGFRAGEIGAVNQGLGLAATIVGALGGGALATRLGLLRSLLLFGSLQALSNIGYAALAATGKSHLLLLLVVAVDNFATGLSIAAAVALLMALCNPRFSATQFALLTSASGALGRLLGAPSGFVARAVGWPLFFLLTVAVALPALALLLHLRRRKMLPASVR